MKHQPPRWWIRVLRSAGLAVLLFFLLCMGFVMIFENSFIYFPSKDKVGKSPGEEVFLEASDGVKLHGWYVTGEGADLTLLWFHGNAGNLEHRRAMLHDLRELPANVLIIDYRGYGRSEGKPDEKGLYRDAQAAWDWLSARTPPYKIVIFGKSLGGGPASELASRVPCGGLILQSTFTSAPDMAPRVMPFFPARWFLRTKYDNLAKVAKITCSKLILHSRKDEVIPFSMGERLFAAAAEPKESAWFDGAGHNDLWLTQREAYYARLREFLARLGK